MFNRVLAEFVGTFWLVFGGCGAAMLSAGVSDVGIGWLGVALAFGLSVVTMAYAVGGVSGGHFNPAVTLGLAVAGRFNPRDIAPYWVAQVLGAIAAAAVLYVILAGQPDFAGVGSFATNGYGEASPMGYSMLSAAVIETVLTAVFIFVILGVTSEKAPAGFAPLAIGLCLTMIHLISIPVTNTAVNPARATGVALFAEGPLALEQLWMFWVAPFAGALVGALVWQGVED